MSTTAEPLTLCLTERAARHIAIRARAVAFAITDRLALSRSRGSYANASSDAQLHKRVMRNYLRSASP